MAQMKDVLAGVHWTKSGNLALHPTAACTPKFLIAQSNIVWTTVHSLLRLPDDTTSPVFDTDEAWHSVVFHGVPMSSLHTAATTLFTWDFVKECLTTPGGLSPGALQECTVLCCTEDLPKKTSLMLCLSFSSQVEAKYLIRDGGYICGVLCRVMHYTEKTCSPSPS